MRVPIKLVRVSTANCVLRVDFSKVVKTETLIFLIMITCKDKGHPITCLCRRRGETAVELRPIRSLGARLGWAISTTLRPLYVPRRPVHIN